MIKTFSYGELSRQVDIIASELLRRGVQPGHKVAIFQYPTVQWAACVIAILKIRTVYIPLMSLVQSSGYALL